MKKIVVVDDDKEIADLISIYFKNEYFEVNTFYESKSALEYLLKDSPDILLLDIMMPEINGFELLTEVRKNSYYPIVFISAKNDQLDILNGLTLGGDSYIIKPFNPLELVARVKAILRMQSAYQVSKEMNNKFKYKDLELDYETRKCTLKDNVINLTNIEFEVLKLLTKNQGVEVDSETIFRDITGDDYYNKACNSIATHIRNIRIKLGDSFEEPEYIQTVWGKGYVIKKDN
ncbi:MAG: response regulator transcription factor [Peptoniphilaceae bacterium]|nr:response regulator transcription factor [Peptoniphilaceae bacterium]MDY6018617.1 response regulator transcription factor [Anaerococcus sp.]